MAYQSIDQAKSDIVEQIKKLGTDPSQTALEELFRGWLKEHGFGSN